jgi:hypothetical protein
MYPLATFNYHKPDPHKNAKRILSKNNNRKSNLDSTHNIGASKHKWEADVLPRITLTAKWLICLSPEIYQSMV